MPSLLKTLSTRANVTPQKVGAILLRRWTTLLAGNLTNYCEIQWNQSHNGATCISTPSCMDHE